MSDKSLRYLLFGQDVSAGKTMGDVATKGQQSTKIIAGAFSRMSSQIGGEFGAILGQMGDGLDSIGSGGRTAKIAAAGGAITGLGVALQMAASSDQQAADQLSAAIDATGNSASDFRDEIDKTGKSMQDFGHSDDDTSNALAKLTAATNDPQKALDRMGVTADLAAAKHISLSEAAGMVAKILNGGGGKALKEYGITMGKGKDATKNGADALDALGKKLDGQAAASMDNFGAKVGVVRTKLGDLTAQIGGALGPALTVIGPVILGVSTLMQVLAARKAAAAVAAEALAVAQATETVTTETATVAQGGLNAALLANPIGLVVLAVVALIGILVLAFNKVGWFHTAVVASMHGIVTAFGWVWNIAKSVFGWLASQWPRVQTLIMLPIKLGLAVVTTLWNGLTGVFSKVVGAIGPVIGRVKDILVGPFKFAFNAIASLWNNTVGQISFSLPSWIPGLGGKGFSMPKIPMMAMGGIVNSPTLAMIGEAGPEAVVPLSRGGLGGTTINVNISGIVAGDRVTIGQEVRRALIEVKNRQLGGGNLGLA